MSLRRLIRLLLPLTLAALPLGAQQGQEGAAEQSAPRLAGIVELDSLSLLWGAPGGPPGGKAASPQPLDIAPSPGGPILLFDDRVLSLGDHLQMTVRTVHELSAAQRLPQGFVPSRLLLNPLSQPMLYDEQAGRLLLMHRDLSDPELFDTGFPRALEAASLRRGGIVLSDGRGLAVFTRVGERLSRRDIPLPSGPTTGLSTDAQDRLWVYDLLARKVRVFDLDGAELYSITPDISGGTLLFPQVFQARADGGFFLGTAGELWCFAADGSVLWKLAQFSAGHRQALPAFYRLAVETADPAGKEPGQSGPSSFFILDPLGNRIMKFVENPPRVDEPEASIEAALAAAFQSPASLQSRRNEVVRLCLEKRLYLQASFFRRSNGEQPLVTDLKERLRSRQAELLAELAWQLESELRIPEAVAAYNRSLSLYRELRSLDPVDPRYPEAVRDLSGRRNALRELHLAENRLRIVEYGFISRGSGRELRLLLANTSGTTAENVEVAARFSGYAVSSWQASVAAIPAGAEVLLTMAPAGSGAAGLRTAADLIDEDLSLSLNLVVRFEHERELKSQHFSLPLVLPAGMLLLPEHR